MSDFVHENRLFFLSVVLLVGLVASAQVLQSTHDTHTESVNAATVPATAFASATQRASSNGAAAMVSISKANVSVQAPTMVAATASSAQPVAVPISVVTQKRTTTAQTNVVSKKVRVQEVDDDR